MYKFIDLFCGIGGFRVALQKQGMECVYSCDNDPFVQEAYKQNFGEKPDGDITETPANRIPKHDILCAGFPCQSFSISGNRGGVSDPRGRLFYEIVNIAKHHKPYILLLENVKNILTIDNGAAIKTIEEKFGEIGYDLHKHVLNASFFGVPQSRERVYFVGIRKDANGEIDYSQPKETRKPIYLENIFEKDVDKDFFIYRDDIQILKDPLAVNYDLRPIRIGIVNKGGQGERIYSSKGHAITLSAFGGGVGARTGLYQTEEGIRRLTIPECKRAMGFPSKHYVSEGMQGYQQLGNAVIPEMITHVWNSIRVN